MTTPRLLPCALALLTSVPLSAQGDDLELSIDSLALGEFVKLAQTLTGKVFVAEGGLLDTRTIDAVTAKCTKVEFFDAFRALAYRAGVACKQDSKGTVHLTALAKDAPRIPSQPKTTFVAAGALATDDSGGLVLTFASLRNVAAPAAAVRIEERSIADCNVVPVQGALLLQGPRESVCDAAHYLAYLDVPTEGPMAKVADGFAFIEGPAWDPKRDVLLFSDIPKNRILELGAKDAVRTWLEPSHGSNGLLFDADGNLYACLGWARQVVRIQPDGQRSVLAERYKGKALNSPNDLALDDVGGLYFTDPRYGGMDGVEQDKMCVYYVDTKGTLTRVIDSLERPNGIVVSNDGKTLVVAEPNKREIWSYPITKPGVVGKGTRVFVSDKAIDGGGPDGMAYDANGNLYATYANLLVFSPDFTLTRRIAVPEKPANCSFGGEDNKTLFVTARTGLYRMASEIAGAPLRTRREKR